jgi:hypothetical protein
LNIGTKQCVWRGALAEIGELCGRVQHEHCDELTTLYLAYPLSFDDWIFAAELLESFERPVLITFDSSCQQTQGWLLFVQAINLLRHEKRLPVGLLLLDGCGHALELDSLVDVTFVTPESVVGMHGARTLDGELATGWRFDAGDVPPLGKGWNVSPERLLWLRDGTIGGEAAEHFFGFALAISAEHALNVFAEITWRYPRR